MMEALVLAAGAGFLLGLRYRVPALVVASAAAVIAGPAIAHFTSAPTWMVLISPLTTLLALQCGYLGGLLLTYGVSRAKPGQREVDPHEGRLATKDCGN
jgi:hypothetical protein